MVVELLLKVFSFVHHVQILLGILLVNCFTQLLQAVAEAVIVLTDTTHLLGFRVSLLTRIKGKLSNDLERPIVSVIGNLDWHLKIEVVILLL